jgi:hypothetical protein
MRIKIVCTGKVLETRVLDADTLEEVEGVAAVHFEHTSQGIFAKLTLAAFDADITVEAQVVTAHTQALLEACRAGARYSNYLKRLQDAGHAGMIVEGPELETLFQDWHDKTHAVLAEVNHGPGKAGPLRSGD